MRKTSKEWLYHIVNLINEKLLLEDKFILYNLLKEWKNKQKKALFTKIKKKINR